MRHVTDQAARESQSDMLGAKRSVPKSCTSMKWVRSQQLLERRCAHMPATHTPGFLRTHLRLMGFLPVTNHIEIAITTQRLTLWEELRGQTGQFIT